jgi:sugar phosphate isomerase/epimerase
MVFGSRVSAWLDSYRGDLKVAVQAAGADGYQGVEISSLRRDFNPPEFSRSARRHLTRFLRDLGLSLDAIVAEFPGAGLADGRLGEQRLDHLRQTLELCRDLGVDRAVARLGGFSDNDRRPEAEAMLNASAELADRIAVRLVIAPGHGELGAATDAVRRVAPGVTLGLDSAELAGASLSPARLAGRIGAARLRDVRRSGDCLEEVGFGEGQVDFAEFLALLSEAGYEGALTIRRNAAGIGIDAMRQGRDYVWSLLRGTATPPGGLKQTRPPRRA